MPRESGGRNEVGGERTGRGEWLEEKKSVEKMMSLRCSVMGMNKLIQFLESDENLLFLRHSEMEDGWGLGCVYGRADQASGGKCVQGIFVDTPFPQTFFPIQPDFPQPELFSGSCHYQGLERDLYSGSRRTTGMLS